MYVQHAIEMQAVCSSLASIPGRIKIGIEASSSLMKTPHIQQTDASSVTCGPPLKPRLKRFTIVNESDKKEEKNKTKVRWP